MSGEVKYNVELMKKVRDQIIQYPRSHNQGYWMMRRPNSECGTVCCVAGWAVHFAGYEPVWNPSALHDESWLVWLVQVGSGQEYISDVAQSELGLSEQEAEYLFASGQSQRGVIELLDRFILAGELGVHLDVAEFEDVYPEGY